jgi:hypothetical protein
MEGSKIISNIDINNFNYLIGNNDGSSSIGSWNNSDWDSKGKPKYNLEQTYITEDLLIRLNKALPERNTVNTTVFDDYPELLIDTNKSDLDIGETETDIYATFIDEGAGYKNTFGYYFYTIINNEINLLGNSDDNTNGALGHYNPTIVFPNASRKYGTSIQRGGEMIPGMKRKLVGNLINQKFQNVHIGFFLLPNGWRNNSIGVGYNNKKVIHTTNQLNYKYISGSNNINNNGIQTILFNSSSDGYIICFEDIERPGGDQDFNDLLIKIETTPEIIGNNDIILLSSTTKSSDLYKLDFYGAYLSLPLSSFNNIDVEDINRRYKFKKTLNFNNKEKRDYYLELLTYIVYNLDYEITILNDNVIKITYCFDNTDIANNNDNENIQIYTFKKEDNDDDDIIVDSSFNETQYNKLVNLQHFENDAIINQDYELVEENISNNTITRLSSEINTQPLNITSNSLAWGDPHIKLMDGQYINLPNENMMYTLLKSDNMQINIACEIFTEHPSPIYSKTAYIKFACFQYDDEYVIIDMFNNLNIHSSNKLNKIKISEINTMQNNNLKFKFKSLLSKDPDLAVRIIELNHIRIWCIMYPNIMDYFNEIFIENTEINTLKMIGGLIKNGHIDNNIINQLIN